MRTQRSTIDEAAEWLATLSDSSCTPEERHAFARWLKRSNVNVEEFLTLSTLTRRLETSTHWPEMDVEQLISEARHAESNVMPLWSPPEAAASGNTRAKPSALFRWPLAAAALLLVLAALFNIDPSHWLTGRTYSTGLGELRSVILKDGSVVQLDAQSRIRTRFTGQERKVELLQGAAIFQAAKHPERPFKVATGVAEIVAVGTSFNVSARQERTIVTVMEGRVRIEPQRALAAPRVRGEVQGEASASTAPLELNPGQQAVIEPHKPILRPIRVDPLKVTAWTARRLYFEDTPLAEAVEEFSRYSARVIRVEDQALAQKRITGTFDAADPASLVEFLERFTDAQIGETREGWIVE